jgi:hypothetical protein
MTETIESWVAIFQALLTPVIGILAAYIAWQQYRIQHRTFSGKMYERRYVVFKAFMSYLADIMREGKTSYQRLGLFYAEASEADFLFSDVISKKREELYQRGVDLQLSHELMYPRDGSPGLPVGPERSRVAHENTEHLKWFLSQIAITKDIFKKEMQIN